MWFIFNIMHSIWSFIGYQIPLNPRGWYSSRRQHIGKLSFAPDDVQAFNLSFRPLQVLDYQEVLLYVTVEGVDIDGYIRLHTQDEYAIYDQYIDLHTQSTRSVPQYGLFSTNIWLPLTYEKKVYATYTGTPSQNKSNGTLYVLAYR